MAAATGSGPDDAGACADGRKDDAAVRQLRRYSVTTAPNEANTAVADGCPDLGDGSLQTTALRTRPSMETMEVAAVEIDPRGRGDAPCGGTGGRDERKLVLPCRRTLFSRLERWEKSLKDVGSTIGKLVWMAKFGR
uniref:Uncharacterized protein n=1 Tax=Oryza sativa subsp. japonica TaxID=39947 RepID=Q6ER95_ORYSJ|nr:hypothetical protein [Oryza sativa Japonica Group]BAD28825.1 hypothetical protein [Oryza sativa Japonica Group]